jgi:hypothetical protein
MIPGPGPFNLIAPIRDRYQRHFCPQCGTSLATEEQVEEFRAREERRRQPIFSPISVKILAVAFIIYAVLMIISPVFQNQDQATHKAAAVEAVPSPRSQSGQQAKMPTTDEAAVEQTPSATDKAIAIEPTPSATDEAMAIERSLLARPQSSLPPLQFVRVMQWLSLPLPSGESALVAPGARVEFVSQEGQDVRIRYAGAEYLIPISATDLK